jgi:hypothetical protein
MFDEATMSIGGSIEAIDAITRLEIDGIAFDVDARRRTIHHPEHSDPAIPFHYDGCWWLQVFLCDGRYETKLPLKVRAWTSQVELVVGAVEVHVSDEKIELDSHISGPPGGRVLSFVSGSPTEVMMQTSFCGRELEEAVGVFPPGPNEIPILAVHSERYGITLSTIDPFGGIEHKHMIYGQGGHASGRILVDASGAWLPKVREQFSYRSAILKDDEGDWVSLAVSDPSFDEIDVWTSMARREVIEDMIRLSGGKGRKVTTYEMSSSQFAGSADVILIGADDVVPPAKTISLMLFTDQASEQFSDRYDAAIRRLKTIPASIDVIDRAWFGSRDVPSLDGRYYGVAFSTSSEASGTAKANLFKRMQMPTFDPCGSCNAKPFCLSVTAIPLAKNMLPTRSSCRIRNVAA